MGLRDMFKVTERAMGRVMLEGIEKAVESRWSDALAAADAAEGASMSERISDVKRGVLRELVGVGAASGGMAALPGAGTGTALATTVADLGWVTMRLTELVMAIGALHGHTDADVEERKGWVLAVLAFGGSAAADATKTKLELGKAARNGGVMEMNVGGVNLLNRRLTTAFIRRFVPRVAEERFAKILPFGIGAVLGAGINGYSAHTIARNADKFFTEGGAAIVRAG